MSDYVRLPVAWCVAAVLLVLLLGGCSGGGGMDSAAPNATASPQQACGNAADCGDVYVAITDADGDFLSYAVDVESLTLKRADGAVVQALPVQTRVDFAQYVDLTEFMTAVTVPKGSYVEGTLRLDYSNAEITVEQNGQPVAARVVGADGNPLGVVDVRVVLDNRNRLVVAPGLPSLLVLDFDLSASHTVDLTTVPATVTARPTLIASLEPVEQKELRLRGPLVSVDVAGGSYVVDVRPFDHRTARLGRVTVHTDSTTAFEVDGQSLTGTPGLQALAAAGAGTATVAFGTLTTSTHRFDATIVHAGSSVPGAGVDTVLGNVLSRSGDELTVRGGTIVRNDEGSAQFIRGEIKVMIGPQTKVFKDGVRPVVALGPEAVSVGQGMHAFGNLRQDGDAWVLDATQGRVRMDVTHLFGTIEQALPGNLTLDLDAIDGRRVAAFDFSGTGSTPDQDADPQHYEIATGALNVSGLAPGQAVRVFGFATPFGSAPADFSGRTVVDYAELRATLSIGWGERGTTAPFLSAGTDGLVLDLGNPAIGRLHQLFIGPRPIDLLALPAAPRIVPVTSGPMVFVIVQADGSHAFDEFDDFIAELNRQLNGTNALTVLLARGNYDNNANVVAANSVIAVFK